MRYYVHSNHVNAWTLKKGLDKLGIQLECLSDKKELLPIVDRKIEDNDVLFFTEEGSLFKYYEHQKLEFLPKEIDKNLIDDKVYFAEYINRIGEKPIPFTKIEGKPQEYPIYLKAKSSWINGRKIPRGYILNSEEDYMLALEEIKKNDFDIENFFYQKLLKSPMENNYSTCGFFDYKNTKRNMIIITRKVMGDAEKIATGSIIETVKDPENLLKRTHVILSDMKYQGPFELEFFYEEDDNEYYVLELNPRFWMQHGIFIEHYNNGLIKRYLNMDKEEEWYETETPYKHIVWMDGLRYVKGYIKRKEYNFDIYKQILLHEKKGELKVVFYPNKVEAAKFLIKNAFKKILKRFV
ncbi:hypothetical protein [Clostridium sp. KNHs214]|uniref:hypothetical protein n=1 Tax=Clostridium sp. KNHs214 TaxID=1540257 RepID=UPI00054F6DF4|nr:hypothetical protein [Clostridium sp. KNHs214]